MNTELKAGIIGCGDFLRLNIENIKSAKNVQVKKLYDPNRKNLEHYASLAGGEACGSADDILDDPSINFILLFTPPWVRKDYLIRAAKSGKHILTTKPLGPQAKDCQAMVKAVQSSGVRCGVIYRRTSNASIETLKTIFQSGEIGRMALYKQDWIHHYPEWNNWALDPDKNGGPFMDAMIHNLNIARYLASSKCGEATFFGAKLAHDLKCNDTESMVIRFTDGAMADLFITWAPDLEVMSKDGNFREHIDQLFMVTDKGWMVKPDSDENKKPIWTASKDGKKKHFEIKPIPGGSHVNRFVESVISGKELPSDIVDIQQAYEDIKIIKDTSSKPGNKIRLKI